MKTKTTALLLGCLFVLLVSLLGGAAALGTPGSAGDSTNAWPALRINEWMSYNSSAVKDPADHDYEDWFELYNPTASAVDLTGWFLSDKTNLPALYPVPEGHIISPFGHLLVWADGEPLQNTNTRPDIHASFHLAKTGEAIVLSAPDGSLIDSVEFGGQFFNDSQGRFPDGGATIVNQIRPTPNAGNLGADVPPRVGCIISGDQVALALTSTIPTYYYALEYKNALGATNWTNLSFFYASSTSISFIDRPGTNTQRFYRALRLDDGD
jgi:hypothetical protein